MRMSTSFAIDGGAEDHAAHDEQTLPGLHGRAIRRSKRGQPLFLRAPAPCERTRRHTYTEPSMCRVRASTTSGCVDQVSGPRSPLRRRASTGYRPRRRASRAGSPRPRAARGSRAGPIEVLDEDAGRLDLLHGARELGGGSFELLVGFGEVGRSQVAAVRAHLGPERRPLRLSLDELTPIRTTISSASGRSSSSAAFASARVK